MNIPSNRRHVPRLRVAVPLEFEGGAGTTRDLSTSGVSFVTPTEVSPGDDLRFAILLDAEAEGQGVTLQCEGRVTRVRREGKQFIVATTIHSFWFEPIPHRIGTDVIVADGMTIRPADAPPAARIKVGRRWLLPVVRFTSLVTAPSGTGLSGQLIPEWCDVPEETRLHVRPV
jgi:hypothetical protein